MENVYNHDLPEIDEPTVKESWWNRRSERVKDLINTAVALIISVTLYVICARFFSNSIPFWARNVIVLAVAIMILMAMNSITKTKPIIGTALIIFLVIIFIFQISNRYFVKGNSDAENANADAIEHRSESIVLQKGDYWVPAHQFKVGDRFTLVIEGGPVRHYMTNSSDTIQPGAYYREMTITGAPGYQGIVNNTKIAISYGY